MFLLSTHKTRSSNKFIKKNRNKSIVAIFHFQKNPSLYLIARAVPVYPIPFRRENRTAVDQPRRSISNGSGHYAENVHVEVNEETANSTKNKKNSSIPSKPARSTIFTRREGERSSERVYCAVEPSRPLHNSGIRAVWLYFCGKTQTLAHTRSQFEISRYPSC